MNTAAMLYINHGQARFMLKKKSIIKIMAGFKNGVDKSKPAIGIKYENLHSELQIIFDEDYTADVVAKIRDKLVKLTRNTWWSSTINIDNFIKEVLAEKQLQEQSNEN